jgi:tryptophan synthase beta chain
MKMARDMPRDKVLLVNMSGRGDKDMNTVAKHSGITL